jgi:hypothetical protein
MAVRGIPPRSLLVVDARAITVVSAYQSLVAEGLGSEQYG